MWFRRNGHREGPTLVLSGGGAMGALQAGVLRVLIRSGFRPGRIVGTSVGALNGAFLAFHPDNVEADQLVDIWRGLEHERYAKFNPVRVAYRLASRQRYLSNSDFIAKLIEEHAVVDDIAATRVPLHIAATNLRTGRKHVFSRGKLSLAVLASTAIPGLFSPVDVDDECYLDGGIIANLDLETAVEAGAKQVLAIDLSHTFEMVEPTNVVGVINRTVDIVMRDRVERDMALLADRADITLIQPEIEGGPGVGGLSHASALIEQGEAFAERNLDRCFDRRGRLRPGVVSGPADVQELVGAAGG